jgi:ATP-dependent DNA helicase PIF1
LCISFLVDFKNSNSVSPPPPPVSFFSSHEKINLTLEQEQAKEAVLSGKNIFLTGAAGTGKSFLLRYLIKILQEKHGGHRVGITSTTGTGALIIGGSTIHSYLGIGVSSDLDLEFLFKKINHSFLPLQN